MVNLLKTSSLFLLLSMMISMVAGHASDLERAPPEYKPAPPSEQVELGVPEEFCPSENPEWREEQTVWGVHMQESQQCSPDNPKVVAAVTKGTNNIGMMKRIDIGLHKDAVRKGKDIDGDGDPDVINITMEVHELNGKAPASNENPIEHEIAPGIKPGFWAFGPKTTGMATEGSSASDLVRMPSPAIRVEEGDRVNIKLENTHYMPHTIHLHGVDHSYNLTDGETGNDGVPQTGEKPVVPGQSRTYSIQPRQPGTMFYHCHVQPNIHVLMGLNGMFIVEEDRSNNTLQTLNIGNGKVRNPSKAVQEKYDQEYDLQYQGVDKDLHEIVKIANDPRVISNMMNRGYDITEREPDYFLLNGKSFPYTVRESQIIVEPNESTKMRVLNGGSEPISLHTHGHKPTITHYDGVKASEGARIQRDVFDISAAQRVDLVLNTTNDGLNSYGPGVWFMHNHKEEAVTNNGIAPGGDISLITYERYLGDNGFPEREGVSWKQYFTEEYYERKVPVWNSYTQDNFFGNVSLRPPSTGMMGVATVLGAILGAIFAGVILWRRN